MYLNSLIQLEMIPANWMTAPFGRDKVAAQRKRAEPAVADSAQTNTTQIELT